jgi:aerobic-type carbon monoxide dehydrogenase small subunit (CoxS/CutS family)
MKKELIALKVNGRLHELAIEPRALLLDVLRQDLRLTGSKRGCDDLSCGACTVLVDGTPMLACALLAASCEGQEIERAFRIRVAAPRACAEDRHGPCGSPSP